MKQVLIATAAAIAFIAASPAFAGPAEEAAGDYAGWRAAEKAAQQEQAQVHHSGHVIYRTNQATR
jgi:uncharacterized protein YfaP (DUF2135 family)